MSHSIMFVCAANVCRSQLMALAFTAEMSKAGVTENWTVGSRGTDVKANLPLCELVTAIYPAQPEFRSSKSHSRALDAEELDEQDLIVTATREERGVVARMRPALRSRTFTLNEATLLGAESLSSAELDRMAASVPGDTVAAYAEVLNARRPRAALQRGMKEPSPLARLFGRTTRRNGHPLDVPDVHHLRPAAHARTLRETAAQVRVFSTQLQVALDAVTQPG